MLKLCSDVNFCADNLQFFLYRTQIRANRVIVGPEASSPSLQTSRVNDRWHGRGLAGAQRSCYVHQPRTPSRPAYDIQTNFYRSSLRSASRKQREHLIFYAGLLLETSPEGWQTVVVAETTTGLRREGIAPRERCQSGSEDFSAVSVSMVLALLPGCMDLPCFSPGVAIWRPPATFCQPSGLEARAKGVQKPRCSRKQSLEQAYGGSEGFSAASVSMVLAPRPGCMNLPCFSPGVAIRRPPATFCQPSGLEPRTKGVQKLRCSRKQSLNQAYGGSEGFSAVSVSMVLAPLPGCMNLPCFSPGVAIRGPPATFCQPSGLEPRTKGVQKLRRSRKQSLDQAFLPDQITFPTPNKPGDLRCADRGVCWTGPARPRMGNAVRRLESARFLPALFCSV